MKGEMKTKKQVIVDLEAKIKIAKEKEITYELGIYIDILEDELATLKGEFDEAGNVEEDKERIIACNSCSVQDQIDVDGNDDECHGCPYANF